ncbi:MAG: hypothetical protein EBW32_12930 [Rhodobacteraceae bacterium]|nr:hypothetical protein [Paracoccaceae bacterium]
MSAQIANHQIAKTMPCQWGCSDFLDQIPNSHEVRPKADYARPVIRGDHTSAGLQSNQSTF